MPISFTSGIVCVLNAGGVPVGTGFIVSTDGLIATCAHVIGEPRPERVTIVFRANNEQREATVLTSCWRSEHAEDVAILQLIGNLPAGVTPLPLGSTAGTDGHHVQTFGFPHVGDIMGVWGRGTVLGIVTEAQLRLIQLSSSEITEGFSGAPVWDESRGRVIGQVVKIATPDRNLRLAETVFATPTETLRAVCPLLSFSEECPYRNLDAFTEADAKFFFGRERVVEELVGSLVAEPRFLAVFGPSGSGKSSVVQAALIPRLRRGDVPDSDRWEIIVTRPSDHSFAHLVTNVQQAHRHTLLIIDQFEELFVTSIEAVRQDIIASLTQLLEHSPRTSIVFVLRDDFYSHFVQHERLAQWLKRGLVNVSSWLTRNELMAIVREPARVMGLSFETGLVEKIVEDTVETGKRSETGYSPTGRSAVLPLLEFTLTQLWERREEGMLTWSAYERIDGVTGGLTRWANEAFLSLEGEQRSLARRIFTDLVYLSSEEQSIPDSRRRRSLASLYRSEGEHEAVSQVIQHLVNARLLVTSRDSQDQEEVIEIIHEALLHEWKQLQQWLQEDRNFLLWQQEIERRTKEWAGTAPREISLRDEGRLLRGRDLSAAVDWLTERGGDVGQPIRDFIEVSQKHEKQEVQRLQELLEEAERQREIALARQLAAQAELTRNQRANQLQRSVLLAIEAWQRAPSLEAYIALRRGLALLPHSIVSVSHEGGLRAVTFSSDGKHLVTGSSDGTVRIWDWATGREVWRLVHGGVVMIVTFSPDGKYLVTTSKDEVVRVWETASYREVTRLQHLHVAVAAFSPDGKYLATATGGVSTFYTEKELPEGPSTRVWEIATGQEVLRIANEGDVTTLAFSPEGSYLAKGRFDGVVVIRKLTTGYDTILSNLKGTVRSLTFSPDGIYLAGASGILEIGPDNTTVVWEAATGGEVARLNQNGLVRTLCFSSSGKYLATGSADGTARLWEVVTAREIVRMYHQAEVSIVKFSSDGKYLVTGSSDGTARLWVPSTGREVARMTHAGSIMDIAISPDGKYLATASQDTTAEVWSMTTGWEVAYLPHEREVRAIAFSPDGKYLATTTVQKTRVWDAATNQEITCLEGSGVGQAVTFSRGGRYLVTTDPGGGVVVWEVGKGWPKIMSMPHPHVVLAATFSPDEKLLATAGADHMLRLWEVATGDEMARIPHERDVTDVAFSPDGSYLATATGNIYTNFRSPSGLLPAENHAARLWKVTDGGGYEVGHMLHKNNVQAVAFSPDGKFLATASWDCSTGILEVATGNEIVRIPHEQSVEDVVFSPDGKYLATVSRDVQLWEITRWREIARIEGGMRAIEGSIRAVAFSPDDRYLAAAQESACYVWLWRPEDLIVEACHRLTRDLTLEEWQRYLDNEPYRKTCSGLL